MDKDVDVIVARMDALAGGDSNDEEIDGLREIILDLIDPDPPSSDREYLERYAGLAANVASILHDRESLPEGTNIYGIIRENLDEVYDLIGRDIDLIENWIKEGSWTDGNEEPSDVNMFGAGC